MKIYGDGELLYTATVSGGIDPIDFRVDLTGVLELKIVFSNNTYYTDVYVALGNCGLWA